MPFTLDECDLSGTDASSSSTTSMTTDGTAEDLARSSGDVLDSFSKGELCRYGVLHPFWGVSIGVLAGCLNKG